MNSFHVFKNIVLHSKDTELQKLSLIKMANDSRKFCDYFNLNTDGFYNEWKFGGCNLKKLISNTEGYVYCLNRYDDKFDGMLYMASDYNLIELEVLYSFQVNFKTYIINSHRIKKEDNEYKHLFVSGILPDHWLPENKELYPYFLYNLKIYSRPGISFTNNFFHQLRFSVDDMIKEEKSNIEIIHDEEIWNSLDYSKEVEKQNVLKLSLK